jgi:Domain of unknown function (DUF1905)
MKFTIPFDFEANLWKAGGNSGWHFVSLPIALSQEIRHLFQKEEEGWGRLPVLACINDHEWETAIWFDTKNNRYLLPLKSEIRKKKNIQVGDTLFIRLKI